ncbi:GTPase HflX [Paraliomyxa miuraensis]|uniref:GTPase HflX n=1 Tax=Paraliomyxa miuraensis TaxID=376150 RepID=UPI00225B7FF6|nr:GTPase HflX [Paraliomyxa miuraensis]MCX4239448.1 GTPase HflX [Paraliomyxa miuraensis]
MTDPAQERPPAVLVAVRLPGVTEEQHAADLAELSRLVTTLGLRVVGTVAQTRERLSPSTVLGGGKLRELAAWTGGDGNVDAVIPSRERALERRERLRTRDGDDLELDDDVLDDDDQPVLPLTLEASERARVVVVDHELSPRMQRNLERATGAEVLDRTHVIVEIFHRHARSREARLQVEIARLSYVAPRLREAGAGRDRQRGGVGGKGAGESALELDRRKIRDRIAELRRELSAIEREQATRRAGRSGQRRVALVGYTNAGKSSLMRALTGSGVYVADKLFATLDTTVRALRPETDPRILVSDTVGFIKKLPHELVASFRSTLDEALEASLLLYVVDASDPTFRDQLAVTGQVLQEIGAGQVASRLVLNKRDRIDEAQQQALAVEFPDAIQISAHDPDDVLRVRELIVSFFDGELELAELFVPYADHGLVRHVYEGTTVLEERHTEEGTHLRVRAPRGMLSRLRHRLGGRSDRDGGRAGRRANPRADR